LGQEVGALEIHVEHLVERRLGGLEDVVAHRRSDAGVVDQQIEARSAARETSPRQ
jgi:hypothetical protein